jgi:hypothetical protein
MMNIVETVTFGMYGRNIRKKSGTNAHYSIKIVERERKDASV